MTQIEAGRREFLTLLGAALASSVSQGAFAQRAAPLNFGFQNTSWGTIGMIAESQDLFRKSGAAVNIHKFDSGKTTRDAMIAGRIDIGVIGATPFVVGAAKGELVAVGIALYGAKTLSIVGGAKAGIKSVSDLKGRKVGSQLGSATDFVFQNKILPKFGLSKSDVHVVNVTFQNHMSALAAGSIDAFAGVEPFPSVAEVEGIGTVLIDYGDFDLQPIMLAANRPVVEGKRDAVIAFLRGWLAGVKVFKEQPDQAAQIVLKHFKDQGFSVSDAVIKLMLSKLDVNPDFTPGLKTYLEHESSLLIQQKNIEAMPDWDRLLNRDLLQQATGGA
jgi:ABC-type nitrate/sulfonate/bicarbonate transport system substrate-binding protein